MEQLPIELMEKILIFPEVSVQDVVNLSVTSKQFHHLIYNNNTIWKSKLFQELPCARKKLEYEPVSYHNELRHIYLLRTQTRAMLWEMASKFYKRVELSNVDYKEWEDLLKEKTNNYVYLVADLMKIIQEKCDADTGQLIPFNTPGNLSQKFYAGKVLRFIRQIHLSKQWNLFVQREPSNRLLEDGIVLVAQWFQPQVEIDMDIIRRQLDEIAELVKPELRRVCPEHPLFNATEKHFETWKHEVRLENEWSPQECRQILSVMNEVLFDHLHFDPAHLDDDINAATKSFINLALKTRKPSPKLLLVIYDAIARRLGLRCEPIMFPSHFLLRFCENQHPDADWYYIDVSNKGRMVKNATCPFARNNTVKSKSKRTMCPPEMTIVEVARDVEHLARQAYSPSSRICSLRSAFELMCLINSNDKRTMVDLATLYMQHDLDLGALRDMLKDSGDDVASRDFIQKVQGYHPSATDDSIEPVKRGPDTKVKFAVGMVMGHRVYGYNCVIFNWDTNCVASKEWKWRNSVNVLQYKDKQPFYNVLADDNSFRYVAEENLYLIHQPRGLRLDDEVGRQFSHYYQTHYVPNELTEYNFPDDKAVREFYHTIVQKMLPGVTPNNNP